MSEKHPSIAAAEADLLEALNGLDLDPTEQRLAKWLLTWDQPTLHTLAGIIRKARASLK